MTALARVRTFWAEALDRPSPLVKQSATTAAIFGALLLMNFFPELAMTTSPIVAWSGVALVVIATGIAFWFTRVRSLTQYALIIPAIDMFAVGAFRAGTGGTASLFASIIILPVIWIATGNGRRYIVYAGVGTSIALLAPYFLGLAQFTGPSDWLRGVFTPIVFAVGAAIVNELSRQARKQLAEIRELADDKEVMLQRTVEFASELQQSEKRYRAYDRMFRGVWAAVTEQSVIGTDSTGLIDLWNPGATKILQHTADDTEDKRYIFDYHLHDELEARARELNYPPGETVLNPGFSALVETARLGEAEVRDWTYVRADGSHVPVQLSVTKRVDDTGKTRGYLFVASDITKALEVARLKDEFVGLISHELRTPLSSILGYLELMRDDEEHPLSDDQQQYLGVAERNANRLLRLVGDLLFTAQVESGKFPLDIRELSLESIVTASVESATPVADAAGIALAENVTETPVVSGDPVRLGQAVDNLIWKAIKLTPPCGRVTVGLTTENDQAVVTVRDTGLGIAASELDQLFARFFRATTATRNAVPGVGLGLTITKAIVTAHQGEMGVESEEGVGTEFRIFLPLASARAES